MMPPDVPATDDDMRAAIDAELTRDDMRPICLACFAGSTPHTCHTKDDTP